MRQEQEWEKIASQIHLNEWILKALKLKATVCDAKICASFVGMGYVRMQYTVFKNTLRRTFRTSAYAGNSKGQMNNPDMHVVTLEECVQNMCLVKQNI